MNLFLKTLVILVVCHSYDAKLNEFYRWKQMTYTDLPDYVLQNIPSGTNLATIVNETSYIPYNNLPIGVTHWNGKLFISVARRNYGVPSTLNVIDIASVPQGEQSPSLTGYPNYEINAIPTGLQRDPNRIISVYRTRADACNRLWFVDTGFIEYPGARQQVQRPAIWVIDLNTNQQIRRFEIPESVAVLGDGFISITVDVDANACDKAFAYLPNLRTYTISVYSFETNNLWTFGHNYFYLEPMGGDFNINGIKFRWSDGPFSIALGPKNSGFRNAYIHAFAALSEYVVPTHILQNASLATRSYQKDDFQYLGYRGDKMQSAMHDIDQQSGVMIFSANHQNAVGCWNLRTRFQQSNIDAVDRNDETMVYPSDLKVDSQSNIWVLTNQIPVFVYGRLNENEYNYRIWHNNVRDAIRNTRCRVAGSRY